MAVTYFECPMLWLSSFVLFTSSQLNIDGILRDLR
jgi:hypothetical protein